MRNMPTEYFWHFTINHHYDSRDLAGSGEVMINGGPLGVSELTRIGFKFWAEALAFAGWAFTGDAPSPESEARWKRLLEEAKVEWDWRDEEPSTKVESPASEEDLRREGIIPQPPRYQAWPIVEEDGSFVWVDGVAVWSVYDTRTGEPVDRSPDADATRALANELNTRDNVDDNT
jgi:hypothetical protein